MLVNGSAGLVGELYQRKENISGQGIHGAGNGRNDNNMTKCGWSEDGKLSTCGAMKEYADAAPSHKKGLSYIVVTNLKTMELKTFGIVYKKTVKDSGLMLNYCPWCGGKIAPLIVNESE